MDYIKEEWRRQQALLETLLLGKTKRQTATEQQKENTAEYFPEIMMQEEPTRMRSKSEEEIFSGSSLTKEETEQTARMTFYPRFVQKKSRTGNNLKNAENVQTELLPALEQIAVMELSESDDAGNGMKELSRAVQRDARRYDGGFTLY